MIGAILGGVAFLLAPTLCEFLFVTGLRNGQMRARGNSYSRKAQSIAFWTLAAVYGVVTAVCLTVAAVVAADFLGAR